MLRLLPAMLKPELYRRIVELVGVDGYWDPILKAGLSQEAYLDVLEAIVEIEYVPKNAMP
jgi:hypothetical protein